MITKNDIIDMLCYEMITKKDVIDVTFSYPAKPKCYFSGCSNQVTKIIVFQFQVEDNVLSITGYCNKHAKLQLDNETAAINSFNIKRMIREK